MVDMLGFDGELERFSRGLDTWVPLDSEASFGAMKRSIDVQRKAGEGNGRARVLLRIKRAKSAQPAPPALTQFQQPAPFPSLDELFGDNQPNANPPTRMSYRPFARDLYSNGESLPMPIEYQQHQQPQQPQPQPPQFGGQHMPPNMGPMQPLQPQMFFQPPPFPPNHGMPPPPQPPQPPFPFDNRPQRHYHHMPHHMPGGTRPFQSMLGAHPMPLPPLVPEPPSMPMMRDIRPASPAPQTEETDAEQVLSLLGMLQEKMQTMGDKVDQIHVEEKKHYESLRRGLKRIKEEKVTSPPVSAPTYTKPADHPDHLQPYCICNYCLKGSSSQESLTNRRGCNLCIVLNV
jgi:hypothetical protein